MPAVPLTGTNGAIKWHYYTAAAIATYAVRYNPEARAWTLSGVVAGSDPFKLTQTPLEFVAPIKGGGALRWPIVRVTVKDGRVAAALGPPLTPGGLVA